MEEYGTRAMGGIGDPLPERDILEGLDRLIAAEAAVNMKLLALEKAVAEKFSWTEQANKALSVQMDHRLESMNEFRESLRDQTARFATSSDLEAVVKVIEADLRQLRENRAKLEGAATQTSVNVALLFAA
jgi:glutamine phosphoribosylpyrophosphate amidotransferase